MKLCTFRHGTDGPRPGRLVGDDIARLRAPSLVAALAVGVDRIKADGLVPLKEVQLCAPIPEPPAVRDFYVFEQHVVTARANRGATVPAAWYEVPVFYFSNPAAIFGPGEEVPCPVNLGCPPQATTQLDYELEVAAVMGRGGRIAGFTIMNDWSARDLQMHEVQVGLGPAKGKDFGTSLGPILVTPDEFDGTSAEMIARVNGEERSRGDLADMHYSWDAIINRAALNTILRPGDIIGSGTVGTGCILEHADGRWLRIGDMVELEVRGIGSLRNIVGPPAAGLPA